MSDDAPIVTAKALTHTYGRETVLEDVSLDVRPGEVTAVVGPNGSGKTTLIRSVVGVQNPTSGRVTYHGPAVTRPVGYLQQRPTFRPGQTVREALTFYASLVGETEADAVDRLEQVGLSEALDRPVEALSGGMTRLLGIAQATVGDPPLVVLDEPASGLDPGMRVRIFEVIEELAAAGAAVLLSSHDLALVERSADTVAVLENGSMARVASPAAFREETNADSLLAAFEATVSGDAATVQVGGEP
jgi:ABC-type multidrug transport system ATPase subunit